MQNYTTSTQYEKLMRMNDKLKEMIHEQNNLIIYISATARKRYENYRTDSRSMIFNMFNFHQKYFNEFPDTRGQILTVNGNVSKLELEQYAHETANFLNRFRSLKLGLK